MKTRRSFLKRLSAAATAFVVAPSTFKCLPSGLNLRNQLMSARVAKLAAQPLDFHEWLQMNYEIMRLRKARKNPETFEFTLTVEEWNRIKHLFSPNSIATQS